MNTASEGGQRPAGPRPSFTDAQRKALLNIPRVTGALSVIGSCLVLYMLFKSSRHGLKRTHNRLLFAISVVDILFSLMFVLGTIMMPSALPIEGAYGNVQTCSFQGSMLQIGYAQPIYNAFLMVYYVIIVCGGARNRASRDKIVTKWVEPFFHVFATLFAIGTAIAGAVLGIFNPSPVGRCAINSFPMGCLSNPRVECQRGENHRVYKLAFNLGPTLLSLSLILISLAARSTFVIRHERAARNMNKNQSGQCLRKATSQSNTHSNEVVTRALLYAFMFLNTYSWITAANLIRVVGHRIPPFWIALVGNVLQPFQGFFNFYCSLIGDIQRFESALWTGHGGISVIMLFNRERDHFQGATLLKQVPRHFHVVHFAKGNNRQCEGHGMHNNRRKHLMQIQKISL